MVLATLASVVLLSACAPEPCGEPVPTASSSPLATQDSSPIGPVVAFDGDCPNVLDTTAMSEAMGEEMNVWEPLWLDGADAELGGVECRWASAEYLSAFATVWVYPQK
jgi:hypothetical protein